MNKGNFRIITAGPNWKPMSDLSKQAGWNQTESDLAALAVRYPESNVLAVTNDNISTPVGSGLVIKAGVSLAWVGMILVDSRYRRQGIATALMKRCMDMARSEMKSSVVGLDATDTGLQVYKRLGFEPSCRIWRSIISTDTKWDLDITLEVVQVPDISSCETFLKKIKLDQKIPSLRLIHLLFPGGLWVVKAGGETKGLVMSRPGRLKPFVGPLLADSLNTARALLGKTLSFWKTQGYENVFLDVPENHFQTASTWENEMCVAHASGCILSERIETSRCLVRMYELEPKAALKSYTETLDYMESEKSVLPYLYATGGPELS
jgi:GNAT superfamily N-acetyltransferase